MVCLSGAAQAAEADCAAPDAAGCPAQQMAASPSWRESIEQAKANIADALFGLQLSAFGDVQSVDDGAGTGKQKLDWGTFELDAAKDFGESVQSALAVVTSRDSTTVPVGFLDYHTFGGRIAPRGRLWVEKGLHVQLGRFDIPFGNDWQFFASKDSVSISRPLTTDLVMAGGYNDEGLRVLGNNGSVNFNTFLLHGFNGGRLLGGRLGLTPFSDPFSLKGAREPKTVEVGLSYMYDVDSVWTKNETALAADAEVSLNGWIGRFEYLYRKKEPAVGGGSLRGWHLTQEYALGETVAWPTTLFARYEQGIVRPAEIDILGPDAGDDRDVRVAAGFKSNLGGSDVVQLKVEAQRYLAATPTTRGLPGFDRGYFWFVQLVAVL